MDDQRTKVVITLTSVGNRPDNVLKVLEKIQGLRDIPENLIKDAPCDISQKVALPIAQKVQTYLERAGARVELREDEQSIPSLQSPATETTNEAFETMTYHLESAGGEKPEVPLYEVQAPAMEEDITYFDVEEDAAGTELPSYSEVDVDEQPEAPGEETPPPPPRRRSRTTRRRTSFASQSLRPVAIGLLIIALVGGGIWWYLSGGFSQFAQQYQQGSALGLTGTLVIENLQQAEISLHHLLATRVSEPVPLAGDRINLRRGDYFVEARQGGQILRYPVYIEGRGHRVTVTVEFPTQPIPDDMAYIPAGWFRMGNKETDIAHFGFPDEVPSIDVYVSAFLMSKYEVTNQEYAQFIAEGGYEQAVYWDALLEDWDSLLAQSPDYGRVFGNNGWESVRRYIRSIFVNTDLRPGPRLWEDDDPPYDDFREEYPVIGITFYEAAAYCRWISQKKGKVYRLPTEAEWEKAARSYEGYFFAYGNEYDPTRANTETGDPKAVGSYPPNGFGVYDLTGNVWEWIADHYRSDAYQFLLDTYDDRIRNPYVFNAAQAYERRVLRGGSFRSVNRINAKATTRYPMFPNDWHTNIGFRYVTTP